MGTVYRAVDRRLETVVAVKELTEHGQDDEERTAGIRQFEREARLLGQLTHPNLPRVTDYFVQDGRCYLVMQFVEGETLESLLKRANGEPLPLRDVLDWGVQLADTLAYLHGQDPPIVFRDVKPANIMVTPDGTIRLIDFGIARRYQEGASKDTLMYGSPGYSPPEQYGRTQTDPRSDIYALGATLHHLITGRDPAPTPFKFASIRSIDSAFPPALDSFIARCVEMSEDKRCQTAAEARDILVQVRSAVAAAPARPQVKGPQLPSPKIVSSRLDAAEQGAALRRLLPIASVALLLLVGGALAFSAMNSSKKRSKGAVPISLPPTGQNTSKPVNVASAAGTLRIGSVPPGAQIVVDGTRASITPADVSNITPGKHLIQLIPPSGSSLAEWSKEVEIRAGETVVVDAVLSEAPKSPEPSGVTVTVKSAAAKQLFPGQGPEGHAGIQVNSAFRIAGAAGKSGAVAALFYAQDQSTPLMARADATAFQNTEGQLSVAGSFQPAADPADYPSFTLFVPESAFPVPYDQVSWRLVIYVDNKPEFQSPLAPLLSKAP
jgi:serine/threonine protein kinase